MTNHQDKELSSDKCPLLRAMEDDGIVDIDHRFAAAHYEHDLFPSAASPQLPVAEQPAGQAVSDAPIRSAICSAITSFGHEMSASKMVLHRDNVAGGNLLTQIVDRVVSALAAAPHSPVAQMSGDERLLVQALRRAIGRFALLTVNRDIPRADLLAAHADLVMSLRDYEASHPSNAVQDAPVAWAAVKDNGDICIRERKSDLLSLNWPENEVRALVYASAPAATVPQVVQAPKTEAWLIERYDANDKLERRVVLSPLSDDVFLDESSEAIALCRVDALLTTASNAGEAKQGEER